MNKLPLIVFSGGLDSTYMLHLALSEGDVHTCYIQGNQHTYKIQSELKARQEIIRQLEELTGYKVINDTIVDVFGTEMISRVQQTDQYQNKYHKNNYPEDAIFQQMFVWLFGLTMIVSANKYSDVRMGLVMGDDISSYLQDIQQAWKSTQTFTSSQPTELTFPLRHVSKRRILREIPKSVLELVWVCELPIPNSEGTQYSPCDECISCRTHVMYLADYRIHSTLQASDKDL